MSSDSVVYHNLVKYMHTCIHTRKVQRKSPLMHINSHASGAYLSILVEGTNAYHYLFVVQTNSGTGAYHYSFVVQTTIGL